jgi:ferric-dicitrate binding protein FerR (iron transport regulator)
VSRREREEAAIRAVLDAMPAPPLPPELCGDAVRRGQRVLRRRRVVRRALWCLLAVAVIAFVVWAATAQPWLPPPATKSPPMTGL